MEECEMIRSDLLQNNLKIEGEFVTQETMEEWGWSENLSSQKWYKWYTTVDGKNPALLLMFYNILYKLSRAGFFPSNV